MVAQPSPLDAHSSRNPLSGLSVVYTKIASVINRRTAFAFLLGLVLITTLIFFSATSTLPFGISWPLRNTSTLPSVARFRDGPITYIPFTFGWTMLLQALRGHQMADWPNIIVIDNSWKGVAYSQKTMLQETYGILDVIPTPVHLHFTQIQALMDKLAWDSGHEAYFWAHTDVLVVPNRTLGSDTYSLATDRIRQANINGTLGVLMFGYDWLSAVTTKAGRVAPWDPGMPQYGSDCDRYQRVRLAGLSVGHVEGNPTYLAHLHAMLSDAEMDDLYDDDQPLEDRVKVLMEIEEAEAQYSWRKGDGLADMSVMDEQARNAEDNIGSGRGYYYAKWRATSCELEERSPVFDVPRPVDWETEEGRRRQGQ